MKSRWMSFPQNTPIHAPILIHNWIGIHKISVDEFSKKHSDSHPEIQFFWKNWMSFPENTLTHTPISGWVFQDLQIRVKLEPNLSVLSDILLIRKTHLPMSLFDWFGIDFVPIRRNWLKILKICLWTKVWLEIAASSQFEIPKRTKNRF